MVSDGEYTYVYNDANRLSKVFKEDTLFEQYWYDSDGQRLKKWSNGSVTYYVGEHFEVENGVNTSYYFANSVRTGKKNSTGTFYYHDDHLGSTSAVTNSSGGLEEKTKYLPFGADQ